MQEVKLPPDQQVVVEFNRVRGRLCGLIESWDLGEKRERAMIQTLKSLTYDGEKLVKEAIAEELDGYPLGLPS